MFKSFSNQELLTELFGARVARTRQDTSLAKLFSKTGSPLALKCQAARELVMRWLDEEIAEMDCLGNPEAVRTYLRIVLSGQEYESFMVLFLDHQNRLIRALELFRGTLSQATVYPREVLKSALAHNAASVILAHNHPSGRADPSHSDRHITSTLKQALGLVDIRVLDHFVVAQGEVYSFSENGLL